MVLWFCVLHIRLGIIKAAASVSCESKEKALTACKELKSGRSSTERVYAKEYMEKDVSLT